MQKIKKFFANNIWLLVILFSLPAIWALFVPGFFGVSDDMHIAWLHQMDAALKTGQWLPRYVPDLSYGFGYPLFNFVFPLPFYLGEIFHILGFSFVGSIKAVFLISVPLSMYFMCKFLREFVGKALSMAGAVLYVYSPYRATDLFVRGAIGEIVSFVFFPLIALSIVKVLSSKKKQAIRWVGIGALSVAGLVTSHNISAYMFLPAAILFVFIYIIVKKRIEIASLVYLIVVIFLGFISSIFFWLPVILDSGLMKYSTVFDFQNHFPTIKQLITPYFGYGASVPGPGDGMSFFLGTISLLAVVSGIILSTVFWRKFSDKQKTVVIWSTIMFFSSIFMMNHRSAFVWKTIPLLPYFQFPWRLLMLTTFSSSIFLVAFSKLDIKKRGIFAMLILGAAILLNYNSFKPEDFLGRTDKYYINRYIPFPVASEEYQLTQEEYLRLPVDTVRRPERVYPRATSGEDVIKNIDKRNSLDAVLEISTDEPVVINYNKYFFPGWTASIDGQKTDLAAGEPFGQIVIEVPAGDHLIEVEFKETNFKRILDIISLMGITLSVIIVVKPKILASLYVD